MTYEEPASQLRSPEQVRQASSGLCFGTEVHRARNAPSKTRCAVCKLDCNYEQKGETGVMDSTHVCSEVACHRMAHGGFVAKMRKMHCLPAFIGMTCFEIIHSQTGRETWSYKPDREARNKACSVNCSHPLAQDLRVAHGLPRQAMRRRRQRSAQSTAQHDDPYQADTEDVSHRSA